MEKIKIELTPYLALQLMRFKPFLLTAIEDPMNKVSGRDKKSMYDYFKEYEHQVTSNITPDQIEDAKQERDINKILHDKNTDNG